MSTQFRVPSECTIYIYIYILRFIERVALAKVVQGLCAGLWGLCGQARAASTLLFEGAQEHAFYKVNQLLPARLLF